MPRNREAATIKKLTKSCEIYFGIINRYGNNIFYLRTLNESAYRSLNRHKKKIAKLRSSPYITPLMYQDIIDRVKASLENEEEEENRRPEFEYCENCLRRHSDDLVLRFGPIYSLSFTRRCNQDLRTRKKFKFSPRDESSNEFLLCQDCDAFLVTEENRKEATSAKYTWPSFIISTLTNDKVISIYGTKTWQLIPKQWRYWWSDILPYINCAYEDISIVSPPPITVDHSQTLQRFKSRIASNMLQEIATACNENMVPIVLCPWGCNEFIFRSGFISIDICFQRFLIKVPLILIHDVDTMKYISNCREDFIRFNNDYDCLLLNEKWKTMPSFCIRNGFGAQVMTCKDHNDGSTSCMIHPPRQPLHILPSKFSDQLCHAVIKPRTVSTSKAQKYSNTYQMHEQRGNFNGIDTCSLTQYRNFKLLSYLLQENESRSIIGRADINALLTQCVNEGDLTVEIASNYRNLASKISLDIENLSYGATYVPIDIAIFLGKDEYREVIWDAHEPHQTKDFIPSFPFSPHPIQAFNQYGSVPHCLPLFTSSDRNGKNTSMLWALCGMLLRVQELWQCVYQCTFYESQWCGWILTYLAKKSIHHLHRKSSKTDPFKLLYMNTIEKLMDKVVSNLLFCNMFTLTICISY